MKKRNKIKNKPQPVEKIFDKVVYVKYTKGIYLFGKDGLLVEKKPTKLQLKNWPPRITARIAGWFCSEAFYEKAPQ